MNDRIVLLCATRRGIAFLQKLHELRPDADVSVFSFREEPWEPPFFDDMKRLTEGRGGRFFEARNVGAPAWGSFWESAKPDLLLAVNWRYVVPPGVFQRPRRGAFVFHDSLLPRYRGFSPTVWAILNGEKETGVTLFRMSAEVDRGDIVDQSAVPIGPEETIAAVTDRVTDAYLALLEKNLGALLAGTAATRPQNHSQATYACKRFPEDNEIDWSAPTADVFNLIRAVAPPYPGAYTHLDGKKIVVLAARKWEENGRIAGAVPGRVLEVRPDGSVVATGDGALLITRVRADDGREVLAPEMLNGHRTLGSGAKPARAPATGRWRVPFNRPGVSGAEFAYMKDAIRRGHASGDGVYTKRCESLLEDTLKAAKVLLTPSGTHALDLAALLLEINSEHEVIVPSFTFTSTANAFLLRGARPVFADVRPDTLNLDESKLPSLITPRTRAIVPVHYAGVGCEMEEILKAAEGRGADVVEDNAHGLFGSHRGRPLGSWGKLAALSFHETKNFTCGEGGALIINDPALVERAMVLRDKGTDRHLFLRGEVPEYTWVDVGSSYLLSDVLAAYLYAQLESREQILSRRRRAWEFYRDELKDWAASHDVILPKVPSYDVSSFHMFHLVLPSRKSRDAAIRHLRHHGILSVFHYQPLHLSSMGRKFGGRPGQCPVAEDVSGRLLRLPFYNDLADDDLHFVAETLRRFDPARD